MAGDGWGPEPRPSTPAAGWAGWEDDTTAGPGWGADITAEYQPPAPAPITGLWFALAAAAVGALTGLALTFLVDQPNRLTAAMAVVAWLLAGIVPVLALAGYQRVDLRRAASIYYRPNPNAAMLRTIVLVIGAIGVALTALHFSEWLARL